MKPPYNFVHVSGRIAFTARGGCIFSFSVQDGSHLGSWRHPDVEKSLGDVKNTRGATSPRISHAERLDSASTEPPAKKQRLDEEERSCHVSEARQGEQGKQGEQSEPAKGKKKKGKQQGNSSRNIHEAPVMSLITSTKDGTTVLALAQHEKTIWTFEHDGNGSLKPLNQRTMPKRPCDLLIAGDTILSADKFGDVYSLPLHHDPSKVPESSMKTKKPQTKPAATTLTVHSKRNLEALRHQQRQLDKLAQSQVADSSPGPEKPAFEYTLQLGHVSMLTAMIIGEVEGRRCIITADRDEHIRVSRYMPQAHVIEAYCLGHTEFVNALVIPSGFPECLVSGGGNDELFVWDWRKGQLVAKVDILGPVRQIMPNISRVTVTQLLPLHEPGSQAEADSYVLATCEEVPGLFLWVVTADGQLHHQQTIPLSAIPLHAAVYGRDGLENQVLVVLHAGSQPEPDQPCAALRLDLQKGRLHHSDFAFQDAKVTGELQETSTEEVARLYFTTAQLRKIKNDEDVEDDNASEALAT